MKLIEISGSPRTVEALHQFMLVGKERFKAHQTKIRAIEKANLAVAAKEAARCDAQDMADILLDAEVRLGELLAAIPDFHSSGKGTIKRKDLPSGVSKKVSHQAQTLANNRPIVEQVKVAAREKGEIPTASQVYKQTNQSG